jgi:acyl-coenzyme A thioesterase PaaI-like protein
LNKLTNLHPFDQALVLEQQGDGCLLGHATPAWANMVGPFGGITAATVVRAIMDHAQCLGTPLSLTINYVAGIALGPYYLHLKVARTNRSTQHWTFEIQQKQADGTQACVLTGTALTAARRTTWGVSDIPMPTVLPPQEVSVVQMPGVVEWFSRYEMRSLLGPLPQKWDGQESALPPETASTSCLWVRDSAGRTLDYPAIAAYADIFFPRVWLRRAKHVPAGTVSMTVYFHADAQQITQAGAGFLLAQARGQVFQDGFFDQSGYLWSETGTMLATTHQLVYFKE